MLADRFASRGPEVVGGKAFGLARLADAGIPVPDGYVIDVVTLSSWHADEPAPPAVVSEVHRAIEQLGDGPLAVRSSAVDEDGVSASYAGMYTSTLGVHGVDGVLDAIDMTLASRLGARAVAYHGSTPPYMAVLIQPMLDPTVAGVAFTADPITGDRGTVRVSGVRGIGDGVSEGTITPDEWDVTAGTAIRRSDAGAPALDAAQARAVAEMASRIEDALGSPQDVEWAIVDDQVIVLQSRPITALPIPPRAVLEGANWEKDLAHYPEQLTPFGWSIVAGEERVPEVFARFGLMIDGLESRLIGGEVYGRPKPIIGSPDSTSKPPPAWVLGLAARIVPPVRRRMRAARIAVDTGLETWPRRWEEIERDEFLARIADVRSVDVVGLADGDLVHHLDEIRAIAEDGAESHFNIAVPYFVFVHRLDQLMTTLLGWPLDRTVSLLASPASRAASGLEHIRTAIATDPRLRTALDASPSDPVGALGSVAPDVAEQLRGWLDIHGWRTSSYDAGSPAVIERPGLVTRLLTAPDSDRESLEAADAFETAIASLPETDRRRLVEALEVARWVYPMREDNVIIVDGVPSGLARRWLLEAGRRLVEGDRIGRIDDAAYLEAPEIIDALMGSDSGGGVALRQIVARRRAEWAWTRAHPGPVMIGDASPPPDISKLPEAGRILNGALLWAMSHEYPGDVQRDGEAGVLAGSPGSAGRFRGPVRIVRGEGDFAKLQHGDVLVCPVTTPAWAVLFPLAGALVTDGGGVLSHAAIVAREHGIPAVLGTRTATTRLRDGLLVEVDGTTGIVRLI